MSFQLTSGMILLKCKKPYDLDMFQVVLNSVLSMKETTHDCAGANIKNNQAK